MDTIPVSLLARIKLSGDEEAWRRLIDLTTPLLFAWTRRWQLKPQDAADLVQEVHAVLVQNLPRFQYDPGRTFRGWLYTILVNKRRERSRRGETAPLSDAEDFASEAQEDPFWEIEYRRHLVARALDVMQTDFEPATWRACWELVVSGRSAADVAAELGLSTAAVYMAKSRVLKRLREELQGLVE